MVYMLTQSAWLNYIVDSKTKYSDYMKLQLKALNYKNSKYHFELEILRISQQLNSLRCSGTSN